MIRYGHFGHLGGPDTITAYSLEDNELWTRYLLGLVIQFGGAFYIFLRSWKGTPLNILAVPMFVAGLIKYGERTWFLKSRSSNQLRKSMIRAPDPGTNYAKFMEEYALRRAQGYNVSLQPIIETSEVVNIPSPTPRKKNIPDAALLQKGNEYFPKFKLLFTDLVLESTDLEESKSFFEKISCKEAFRVIEIELGNL